LAARHAMIRPPPAGMSPQRVSCSTPQIWRIASACRGRTGGIGPSGGRTGAASGAIGGAAAAGGGAPPWPIAVTAFLHSGDSAGALTCRQRSAAEPPGFTPGQCTPKSERQAARTAPNCCGPGLSDAAGGGAGGAGGVALSCTGAGVGAGGGGAAACFRGVVRLGRRRRSSALGSRLCRHRIQRRSARCRYVVALQACESLPAARLNACAMRHEIGTTGLADCRFLLGGGLLG